MNLRVNATGLVKSHLSGRRPNPALIGTDLVWDAGCLNILTGDNGAGKTTLLRILAGLDVPDRGQIDIQSPQDLLVDATPKQLRQLTAWLPDRPGFPAHLSARQAMEEVLLLDGVSEGLVEDKLNVCAEQFAVDHLWHRPAHALSRGQQAQLALARMSLLHRLYWWLDEPFAALDAAAIERACQWIETRIQAHEVVVLCTHHADGGTALARQWSIPVRRWHLTQGRLVDLQVES